MQANVDDNKPKFKQEEKESESERAQARADRYVAALMDSCVLSSSAAELCGALQHVVRPRTAQMAGPPQLQLPTASAGRRTRRLR